MEEVETHKEKIYKILKKTHKGAPIPMTPIAQEVGCTLSHLSIILRMAKEAGFLRIHDTGDYAIIKIPKTYQDFKKAVNKETNEYRKETRGKGRPRRKGFSRPPAEISKENILSVIDDLIQKAEKLELLKKKYASLLKLTKKLKKRVSKRGE